MHLEVIESDHSPAEEIMFLDAKLLADLDKISHPILHFYEWQKQSATYGYFIHPEKFLNLKRVQEHDLDIARRPTGGGIVFHLWDMAFSFLIPACSPHFSSNALENYAFVNHAVLSAIAKLFPIKSSLQMIEKDAPSLDKNCMHFCMAKPTKYDVTTFEGKKIVGAAQRKQKSGFLHQGTISLITPSREYLASILLPGTKVLEAMEYSTFPLLGEKATVAEFKQAKRELRQVLHKTFIDKIA